MFSLEVEPEEKDSIAKEILKCQPDDLSQLMVDRFDTGFEKLHLPNFTNISTGVLLDLIDIDAWLIFHLLALDTAFLNIPASQWNFDDSFQSSKQKVTATISVYDVAERHIKLSPDCSDYLDCAHFEELYQSILQMVEKNQKLIHDLRKFVQKQLTSKAVLCSIEHINTDDYTIIAGFALIDFVDFAIL